MQELVVKYVLPHLADGLAGGVALVALGMLWRINTEMSRRKVWEARTDDRIGRLIRIHCAKYAEHTAAFLEGANGNELRDAIANMRKRCDEEQERQQWD